MEIILSPICLEMDRWRNTLLFILMNLMSSILIVRIPA